MSAGSATQSSNTAIRVTGLQILVRVVSLYYEYLSDYMDRALFAITMDAMNSGVDEVALQGIEFWSSLFEEEIERILAAMEGEVSSRSASYADKSCTHLLPSLLERLKQPEERGEEEASSDEWTVSRAASVCLLLLSECVDTKVIAPVIAFVQANIGRAESWSAREAAVMAFGSIVSSTNQNALCTYVREALPVLLQMASSDWSVSVRDTAHWAIGRMCEGSPDEALDQLQPILQLLLTSVVREKPCVAFNACWALESLVQSAFNHATKQPGPAPLASSKLTEHFITVAEHLVKALDRADCRENNLFHAAYGALAALVKFSSNECREQVTQVAILLVKRLRSMLEARRGDLDCVGIICATLQPIIQKLGDKEYVAKIADELFMCLLVIVSDDGGGSGLQTAAHHEDAVATLSILCDALQDSFLQYVDRLRPIISSNLSKCESKPMLVAFLGLFSDVCRVSIWSPQPALCDECIPTLLKRITDEKLDGEVRAAMLASIGDAALSLGIHFVKHLEATMTVICQAAIASLQPPSSPAIAEYYEQLRENCLLACAGILNGVTEALPKTQTQDEQLIQINNAMNQYACFMIDYIDAMLAKPDIQISEASQTNLLGIVVDTISSQFMKARATLAAREHLVAYLERLSYAADAPKIQRMADWAHQHLKIALLCNKDNDHPMPIQSAKNNFFPSAVTAGANNVDMNNSSSSSGASLLKTSPPSQ